jgi:protease II
MDRSPAQRSSAGAAEGKGTRFEPPRAAVGPFSVPSPNGDRIDNYYWLRDDRRKDREVLAYIQADE